MQNSVAAEQADRAKIAKNWQVTATTITCDKVGREGTIMISKEWVPACEYYKRWGPIRRQKK